MTLTFCARSANRRILLTDKSLAYQQSKPTFTRLVEATLPGKGDLVAIDAEFVSLAREDAQIRSSGRKATVKPAHMACARISLVAGEIRPRST